LVDNLSKTKTKNFDLPKIISDSQTVIKTAKKNHNSIKGTNFYAQKFLSNFVSASKMLELIRKKTAEIVDEQDIKVLANSISSFFDTETDQKTRNLEQRKILQIFKLKIQPNLNKKKSHIATDDLFPLELTQNTKPYLETISVQACGNYDLGYYDASAVMIRRLLETLIIELFESKKISKKIKNLQGHFFFLEELINKLVQENGKKWNLSRNSLKCLPKLKDIGDKSAHSRYFTARKSDLDKFKDDLRVVIEELVQISK